ncbi:MAG: response regulator transcription factor [Treponema sp.]|jgi:DNA-binding response OmpR family regulator|nr:response regulator transcription factor [Treponema sp.]
MKEETLVLVVDDEEKILEVLSSYLKINGFRPLCAKNGQEGMDLFQKNPVSLALLDVMLPDLSGEEVCRRIRAGSDIPIIMITAQVDEESIIRGLHIGADDYVTKPFSPRQVMARVQAALRRKTGTSGTEKRLVSRGLVADIENRRVQRNGTALALTPKEYKILITLMSRPAKIFTRDEILEQIQGDDYDSFDRTVDTHIKNLRQKIEDDPKAPVFIHTVYGMGYRFAGDT